MTHNQAMLQTQLQQMMKDTKSIFGYVAPPKLSNNNRKNESHSSKKKHTSSKPKKSQRPKPLVYKVLVPEPEGLNAAECAALRAIAHIFDPDLTCVIKDDKTVLIIQYLKDILSNSDWYTLQIPSTELEIKDYNKVKLWHELALALIFTPVAPKLREARAAFGRASRICGILAIRLAL